MASNFLMLESSRFASSRKIAQDDSFVLFKAVVFRKTRDQFSQKCRENKFVVRDFTFQDDLLEKTNTELQAAEITEKELWSELLRVARINFSEAFQILVHLKIVRLFVESVLRYGLPANYTGLIIKPDPKTIKRTLSVLTTHLSFLASKSDRKRAKGASDTDYAAAGGEYQSLMEQEYFDFVLFEVPWVVT